MLTDKIQFLYNLECQGDGIVVSSLYLCAICDYQIDYLHKQFLLSHKLRKWKSSYEIRCGLFIVQKCEYFCSTICTKSN